jgi:hypothetical protein
MSDQPLLLRGVILKANGHDARHGLVAVTDKHLFTVPHELDMGAELRLEVTDVHGFHAAMIA